MPDDKELSYYRIDPNEAKIGADDSVPVKVAKWLLAQAGASDPSAAFGPPPALDFSLREPANSLLAKIVNRMINSRNEVYHATYTEKLPTIFRDWALLPRSTEGVSTSRVPNISTMPRPIRLVLDAAQVPKGEPIAEAPEFSKTIKQYDREGYPIQGPNPDFEFENRTQGKPISVNAIKKILLTRGEQYYFPSELKPIERTNIPMETVKGVRELNVYRARRAWDEYVKTKAGGLDFKKMLESLFGGPKPEVTDADVPF